MKSVETVKLQANKHVMMVTHSVLMDVLLNVRRKMVINAMESFPFVVLFVAMESLLATNSVMMATETMEMDAHKIVKYREEADVEDSLQDVGNEKSSYLLDYFLFKYLILIFHPNNFFSEQKIIFQRFDYL